MLEILFVFAIFDAGISIAYENFKQKVSCEKKLLKEMQKLSDFRETAKRDLEELNAEISQFKSRYSENLDKLNIAADEAIKLKNHIDKQFDVHNKF